MPTHTNTAAPLRKGDTYNFTIETLGMGGKGIARHNGMAVFLNQGIPGQTVSARITKSKKRFAEANVIKVLTSAPDELTPFCPHFSQCGGCQWQHLPYEKQLYWKHQFIQGTLQRIGKIEAPSVAPVIPSPRTSHYRNKMEFVFAPQTETPEAAPSSVNCKLGLRKQGSHQVIDITECHLQSARCNMIINSVRDLANSAKIPPYNEKTNTGFLRFLVVREPEHISAVQNTSETMQRQCLVQFIVAPDASSNNFFTQQLVRICDELQKGPLQIGTVIISERRHKAQIAYGEQTVHIGGTNRLTEEIAEISLGIDHDSFLQVNSSAATILYQEALRMADIQPTDNVWDGYCGVGSISLLLAQKAKHVTGFELGEAAVRRARQNAESLEITNTSFVAGDIRKSIADRSDIPDVIVVDPPRAGMHEEVTEVLLRKAPKRIVYISCDPATQARDIQRMTGDYYVDKIQPVDLFPHSAHIENIVLLKKR